MSETVVRKHSPSNYALERYGQKAAEGWDVWFQLKDGFVSPEKALEYAAKERIEGQVRVVRIASPLYGGHVVTPEPVYSLKKVVTEEKKARKPRVSKASEKLEDPPANIVIDEKLPDYPPELADGPDALPPDEGLNPDPDETV